jgi:hypothetical protein
MKMPTVKRGGNRPIDLVRDGGGSAKIPEGYGNVVSMKGIGSRIYFLAERGVTSGVMADHIDPERTNPNIPFVVQRAELAYGLDTPFMQRTLCAAFELVDQTHLPDHVAKDKLLEMALDVATSLAAVIDVTKDLLTHQAETSEKQLSAAYLPRTENLKGKVMQSLAHLRDVENTIKEMTIHFYPKAASSDSWTKDLRAALETAHGSASDVMVFFKKLTSFLFAIADHRNAMIHRDKTKWVTITDYELEAQGSIVVPTIEITHPRNPVPRTDVAHFLKSQVEVISCTYESFLGWLCDLNVQVFHEMFDTRVAALRDGEMRNGSRIVWQTTIKEGYEMIEGKIQRKT